MARTLSQQMGDSHEADIAEWIGGRLQKGSGNQWHNQGDAKNGEFLTPHPITADGKSTLASTISVSRAAWRKIREQTFNQIPMLFLRFYKDGRLREVEADLAVLDAQTFSEILDGARKWSEAEILLQESLSHSPGIDDLRQVLTDAREWRTFVDKIESAPLIPSGPPPVFEWSGPYFCPTAEEVEQKGAGGFDQCCGREDLHVPLPEGEATERLSKILSDRQKDKAASHVYLSTSCLHGEHGYCQGNTGAAGTKIPAQCKFCASACICECHGERQHNGCDCCR